VRRYVLYLVGRQAALTPAKKRLLNVGERKHLPLLRWERNHTPTMGGRLLAIGKGGIEPKGFLSGEERKASAGLEKVIHIANGKDRKGG